MHKKRIIIVVVVAFGSQKGPHGALLEKIFFSSSSLLVIISMYLKGLCCCRRVERPLHCVPTERASTAATQRIPRGGRSQISPFLWFFFLSLSLSPSSFYVSFLSWPTAAAATPLTTCRFSTFHICTLTNTHASSHTEKRKTWKQFSCQIAKMQYANL